MQTQYTAKQTEAGRIFDLEGIKVIVIVTETPECTKSYHCISFSFSWRKWVFILHTQWVDYSLSRGLCLSWVCVSFSFLIQHLWAVDEPVTVDQDWTHLMLQLSVETYSSFFSLRLSFPLRRRTADWEEVTFLQTLATPCILTHMFSLCIFVKLNRSTFF